jgi:AcrR family transcriptional regulator
MVKRRTLTREQVIAAARDLANEEGLDKLTMRAISARVGVEAPSLYTHVVDKEDLLDGLAELIFSEVRVEPSDDTLTVRIEMYSLALRRALLSNAHLAPVAATRPVVSVSTLHMIEQALGELMEAGLDARQAIFTLDSLVSFVIGHALTEIGDDPEFGGHSEDEIAAQRTALPAERFPNVAATLGQGQVDRDAEFQFGIGLIIKGVLDLL